MEFLDAVRSRHSVRRFHSDPVERSIIERIIEAAALAPSPENLQPWHFHVATGETRERILAVMRQTTIHLDEYLSFLGEEGLEAATEFWTDLGNAPVVIAVSLPKTDDELSMQNNWVSAGAAIENLLLAAVDQGLDGCNVSFSFWIGDQLAEVFEVPEGREIASMVVVGRAAAPPAAPVKRGDVVTYLD